MPGSDCGIFCSSIDEVLPRMLLDAAQVILNMIGAIVVTAVVNPYFLVPISLMAIAFWFVRRAYLKTSRSIKRLEANGEFWIIIITMNDDKMYQSCPRPPFL